MHLTMGIRHDPGWESGPDGGRGTTRLDSIVGWRLPGQTILWQLRLPRVLLAGLVGGGLALAGACVQGLFRNPWLTRR